MKEKKTLILSLVIIIAIIIISIMGYSIYNLSNNAQEKDKEINKLKEENQKMQSAIEVIRNSIDSVSAESNNENNSVESIEPEEKTDEELVEETAKNFIKAVNEKDFESVEKYSSSGIASSIKQYNVSNMEIKDYSNCEKTPNGVYVYIVSYDFNYNGITNPKDLSMGHFLCIEKQDGKFVVTTWDATGV